MEHTTEQILDHILIPRPNGSENLATVGAYLKQFLGDAGAEVSTYAFTATPHGFQLVWTAVLLMMLVYVWSIAKRRFLLALVMCTLTPLVLLAEFEYLKSPVSGLLPLEQENIVGRYPGAGKDLTLVFTAHYDTTTHFGDHFDWGFWGSMQGPAQGLTFLLVLVGIYFKRKGRPISNGVAVPLACLAVVPFAAMFWFQTIGPLVREPGIGAIDNGGSIAALLLLAEKLEQRDAGAATSVELVFPSAEEERTLGSWAYAADLAGAGRGTGKIMVINLESVGAVGSLAYVAEDGFATRRFRSSPAIIEYINTVARRTGRTPLVERALPFGTLTDGRSFLAHGLETITLRSFEGGAFPRRLHSRFDSRDRLSTDAVEDVADFLWSIVAYADARGQDQTSG
jgi:hypothetical protein